MSKVVLDSSVIIALSNLGYLHYLNQIFSEILIPNAIYEEICVKGAGLTGDRELQEGVKEGSIHVKNVKDKILISALLDPLALGEAEVLVLTLEEKADYAVIDDKVARARARFMGLNVIGTFRVLRLMFDADLIDKREFLRAIDELKQLGFRISEKVIEKVKERL